MKVFNFLFITILFILIVGCKRNTSSDLENRTMEVDSQSTIKKEQEINQMNMNKKIVIESLPVQEKNDILNKLNKLKEEIGDDFDYLYTTDIETISLEFPIDAYLIKDRGIIVSEKEFKDRINTVLNISLDKYSRNLIKHSSFYTYMVQRDQNDINFFPEGSEWDPSYHHLYISVKYKIIGVGNYFSGFGINDVDKFTIEFPLNLYYINNFILSDSQSSLTWLINNDIEFLELLVREFGYDKNEKINKVVLRYIFRNFKMFDDIPNYSQFNDVFFKKDCQGKLSIRKGLLKTLEDETNSENLMYIYGLINYFFDFCEYSKEKAKYSEKEISEIFVNIAVVEERMRNAYYKPATPEWNNRSDAYYVSIEYPKLFEIAENNNYFDIPFDAVLEMVQVDGEPM